MHIPDILFPVPIVSTTSPSSNRLQSVTGALTKTYTFDNTGNTLSDGATTYTYTSMGRMNTATKAGLTTTYAYNALGQRVKKTNANQTIYFVYDESGHLLGEYDQAGNLIEEIVWLNDTPIATIRSGSCGMAIFYIHTDHLNTPRRITKRSTPDIIWRWDSDAFGTTPANENPNGLGTFTFNLRFPGQYYDQETGLFYNYFRDYDPETGRYRQSDPIGLAAGVNTYAYVNANPISFVDPLGLDKFILFDQYANPVQYAGAKAEKDDPNVCKVYAHGNWTQIVDQSNGVRNSKLLFADDLNKLLNGWGCNGKPVELYACSTGREGPKGEKSLAELLSKLEGRNGVRAPNRSIWYTRGGLLPNPYGHKNSDINQPINPNDKGKYVDY